MEIPYTYKARPDTGLYNAKVGIWLFLASEIMLFGALFSAYILLRVSASDGFWPDVALAWPRGLLNIPIGTFNTAVLITSSVTVVLAWASLKMNNFARFRVYMVITVVCAFAFLGIKSFEYNDKFSHYVVRLKDGKALTGHIEVNGKHPGFWNFQDQWDVAKLADQKVDKIKVEVDPERDIHGHAKKHAGHDHEVREIAVSDIQFLGSYTPSTPPVLRGVLPDHRFAWLARAGRCVGPRLLCFPGCQDVEIEPGTIHQPHRGRWLVLALR